MESEELMNCNHKIILDKKIFKLNFELVFMNEIYYRAEYDEKILHDALYRPGDPVGSCFVQKRTEVILTDSPKNAKSAAEYYAVRNSLFPGQLKFTGKLELATEYNDIIAKRKKTGLVEKVRQFIGL